jgi:hypothetical protein
MGIRDRSNGPSLAEATYKSDRRPAPSPERKQAELDQAARDCADVLLLRTEPAAWVAKHFPKKG